MIMFCLKNLAHKGLTKFSSMAILEAVMLTASIDENFVKMTLPFQCF